VFSGLLTIGEVVLMELDPRVERKAGGPTKGPYHFVKMVGSSIAGVSRRVGIMLPALLTNM